MLRLVPVDPGLPGGAHRWRERQYAVAQALFDLNGDLANVQVRSIHPTPRSKVLNPRGGSTKDVVFANPHGRAVLRGEAAGRVVFLTEGMTDTAALSFTTDLPILGIPGADAVGTLVNARWSSDTTLVIAFDRDAAGDKAVSDLQRARGALETVQLKRLKWPSDANDACDVLEALGRDGLATFIARQVEGLTNE